jgi:putative phosphoesterase
MKIAVLSDVHGNVPALEAVLEDIEGWAPDEVIVNGDLVSRGPCSLECLKLLERWFPDARLIKGNHESFVLACADQPRDPEDSGYDMWRIAQWTTDQLGEAVEGLRAWPEHIDLIDLEGGSFHVTHGSRLGNRDGIHAAISDAELASKLGDPRDLFIASHTHRPFMRRFAGKLVVNVGSVGQPFDGDRRAAYGRFWLARSRWRAEIARIAFDRERAERDLRDSGLLETGGPLVRVIELELRDARMLLGTWMTRYGAALDAGAVTVADAVEEFLDRL